jgi:RHS repeat-associated protein
MKKYIFSFLMLLIVSLGYGQVISLQAAPPVDGGGGTTPTRWYEDLDGDTYGNPASSILSAIKLEEYVKNKLDFDDSTPYITNIKPTLYFCEDIDRDTYGNPNTGRLYSIKPPGYVPNGLDCNDNDGTKTPNTVWYFDGDHDGHGNGSITTSSCLQPTGYVLAAGDYNDGNGAITNIAPQTFYFDFDKDTFGNPYNTVYCSVRPDGYVTNNQDCNDGDITINPNKVWYLDGDGDNFGVWNVTVLSCTKPIGYADNGNDCNDGAITLNPDTVWYYDNDDDSWGSDSDIDYGCYASKKYIRRGGDCDDNNKEVHPNKTWYWDGDHDGFGVTTNVIKSCTKPEGYIDKNGDCDDGNPAIRPNTIWYYDNDGDGHGTTWQTMQSCTKPDKYVDKSDDCADNDITVYKVMRWYPDIDGDTFGDPADSALSCEAINKHVLNNSDLDDGNGCITNIPPRTFYEDFDKDTYGNPNVSKYCSLQPPGYVDNANDYNDRDEFIINIAPQTFYEDFDTDTFGNPNVSVYRSIRPTDWVTNGSDCNDRAILINPNKKWYADNEPDGLGDPSNFILQCTKPAGNYVEDNSDNCPSVIGTSSDCSSLTNPSSDYNYIITTTYKQPTATILESPSADKAQVNITYFDGLGRPIQQIANKQSNSGKDIITPIGYDDFGRQTKEYLPYAATSSNMAFEANAAVNAINFYSTEKYENMANPFSEKKLESSPLGRVLKQAAPGTDWVMDGGHEIKMDYQTNTSSEVKLYKASTNWNAGSGLYDIGLSENGTYDANELIKTVTYDENTSANPTEAGGSTVEFKDKEGQVVLKRTYDSGTKHDTYYVYDNVGNLSYVIPPKADGAINPEVLDGLCYQYKYDYRNRLAEKKLPGKQWEFIVYDKLDRPVATGPANSPFKDDTAVGWLITKYDAFNRPVYTGWLNSTSNAASRKTMQDTQNAATVLFETKQSSGTIDGIEAYYSNVIAPTSFKLLTVNYYDTYNYPNAGTVPTTIEGETVLATAKGLATGSWTRALTLASVISGETASTFYDSKGRPIRSNTQNHLGGYTNTDSKLDFTGKPLYTITKHKLSAGAGTELTIKEEFTYSAQDRLLTHTHQINGGEVQLLAENTYDDLGQLIGKKVGNNMGNPLQKVNYNYNIRGWLTEINKTANLQQDADPRDLFAFKINYNKPTSNANVKSLYNGNIAETFWRASSDTGLRSYGYQYDDLNRLKKAIYQKPEENIPVSGAYNESLSYDKNGNIMSLQRFGGSDTPSIVFQIDDLAYDYSNVNSNQLAKVTDSPSGNDNQGFVDGNKTGDDYSYDANGNMITDKNKNITGILYNHLNLPAKITFGTGNTIAYIYNAAGQKLEKKVTDNGVITQTKYFGGFQYKNNVLQYFPTAEGYVNNTSINATDNYNYVFNYTDHLGNIRVSYKKNAQNVLEILEESNYYPFGLKHQGYNVDNNQPNYKYKYNGKELQDELQLNVYDMDARQYDPAIGRWMVHDPLVHHNQSPYSAFNGNPIYWSDPSGMAGEHYDWDTGKYVNDKGKQVSFETALASVTGTGSEKSGGNDSEESNNSDTTNENSSTIKFPKGEDYEKKYPRLTKVAKQLHSYVKNNSDLLYYLSYYSGYSTMEVLEKLEYGKGTELQSWFYKGEDSDNNGWTPNTGNFITVNAKFVNGLEIAKTNETIQATSFLLMTTILHEFIHSSRVKNNLPDVTAEYGKALEKYGFGEDINKNNANEYYKKNNWNFKY